MSQPDVVPAWQRAFHERVDPHVGGRSLSDLILGGQDGIVNVLGVLLGVAAAGGSSRIVLAGGLATALAGSLSMAAVAYTSTVAAADVYRGEREREYRHVRAVPTLEREEVRELYRRKGFGGAMLDRIVDTITADPDVWVAVMMTEELGLVPVERGRAARSALIVGASALVGSLLPLLPFLFLKSLAAICASLVLGGAALFAVGAYKARRTGGRRLPAGIELAAIGLVSALAAWGIGALFGVSAG